MNIVDSSGWLEYFADGPMADAIMLATAEQYKAEFWTQDDDFAEIKGVHYFPKKSG